MNSRTFVSKGLPIFGLSLGLCTLAALAEEGLAPMAGAGGVMRDAERRALAAPRKVDKGAAPDLAAASGDLKASAADARALGVVNAVRVTGSRAFAEEKNVAGRILDRLAGETRTFGEIRTAVADVRRELMNEGYYLLRLSLAKKDTYDPATGVLTVQVDEGRFGRLTVKFEGEAEEGTWYSRDQIVQRFDKIAEGDAFDYARFRRVLSDVNSHPDLTVDTQIDVRKPIEGEGEDRRIARYADLGLTVHESCPFHAVWEVNNYGMEEIEEWQTSLTLQYLNLTKHDDVLTISPSMSFNGDLFSTAASYLIPHTWWLGGNSTLYGGYSYLDANSVVPQLDLEGTGWFVGLNHSENVIDTDDHLLAVSLNLMMRYIDDQYTALGYKLGKRDVTIFPLSAALSYTGRRPDRLGGRNFATLQGVFNLASAGDDIDEMWSDAEENYWILRCQLARLQPLFGWEDAQTGKELHQWTLFSKIEGQYTSDVLIPVEKLSLGGFNTVRGYHARGYLGDYGLYGTEEMRTPILVDGIASWFGDRTGKSPFDRIQGVAFFDWGYTCYNDLPSSYDDDEWLCSAGVGFRAAVTKYCQAKFDIAFPLHDGNNDDDEDLECYFSMQVQF